MITISSQRYFNVRKSDISGVGCQAIEGNPLTQTEIAMFEAFERDGWTPEQRRAHILALVAPRYNIETGKDVW